jgi:putative hemolysin
LESSTDTGDPLSQWVLLTSVWSTSFIFYGLILLGLLLLSALVSGSEVGFFSLTTDERTTYRNSSDNVSQRVIYLLDRPKLLLATILIFNNLINVSIVTLSTFVMWELVGSRTTEGATVAILTLVITFAIVFFGEVIPKVYANHQKSFFIRNMAYPLAIASFLFKPLAIFLIRVSDVIEKRIQRRGYKVSVDEINHALEITTGTDSTEEEKDILRGIVNFGTISARQIMQSRMDITAFDVELDFHELMDKINKSGYSRVPIYRETIDKIEGILYIKDLLPHIEQNEYFPWQKLIRPSYFIPENKKIDDLLRDFQARRVHMAIVVDEYGGTSGLITLEDIIEEIVGEINDEYDVEDRPYTQMDESTYVFEGKTSLNDFCKILDIDSDVFTPVRGDSESLGGLMLELFERLPNVGERTSYDRFVFTVVAVDTKKIKRIKVVISPPIASAHS